MKEKFSLLPYRTAAFFCALLMLFPSVSVHAEEAEAEFLTASAKSYILMDAASGEILLEKNADEALPPASITKVMTMLLVLEAIERGECSMTETVTASAHAVSMGGSQIWLKENEQMTVEDLFKATAVGSANDAAMALAEHICGSEEAFVARMNERAAQLQMTNTVFHNPTGLDAEGHVSTARDIALMSKELLKHETARTYSSIWMDTLRGGQTQLVNTNKLVRFYKGCIGLKTGTTDGASSCLSAAAERGGMTLIAVVMGCPTSKERFADARALLDYGFSAYSIYTPQTGTDALPLLTVSGGTKEQLALTIETTPMLLKKTQASEVKEEILLPESVEAPVAKGDQVGELCITAGDRTLSFSICAADDVPRLGFWFSLCLLFSRLIAFA